MNIEGAQRSVARQSEAVGSINRKRFDPVNNRDIATRIRQDYAAGNFTVKDNLAKFTMGRFSVQCRNTATAVANMADKFDNNHGVGFYRHDKTSVGPRRYSNRFNIKAFRDFAKDGELDNAVEYAKNYGIANLPVEVQALVRSWA